MSTASHADRPYAVAVDGLRVVRGGREVLHGIGFRIPRGTVTGVLGPSGCGKTTLLRAVVGAQIVAGGTVTVLGKPAGARELRGRIGYATQGAAVYSDLTVAENLRFFAAVLGARTAEVGRVIDDVGLAGCEQQPVAELSGGQRSRASLAVALLGSPDLVVLDEPTVGLDPVLRNELWTLFHELASSGATLLVSSHVMDEAVRCERLLLLRDGGLLADGTPASLCSRTGANDVEQAFLRLVEEKAVVGS
ncbi:MAG: ABC transporter ATP-binding protein [Streptosporangiales bacterium]